MSLIVPLFCVLSKSPTITGNLIKKNFHSNMSKKTQIPEKKYCPRKIYVKTGAKDVLDGDGEESCNLSHKEDKKKTQ